MSIKSSPDPNQYALLNKTDFAIQGSEYRPLVLFLQARLPTLMAIYAFGSKVKGCADESSDLDLAVLVPGYIDPLILWELAGQLEDVAACPVDLVDMRAASTVLQYQIVQTGVHLWLKQPDAGIFESFVLSEKIDLDRARSGVLMDINQRGKVYAR